MINKFKIKVICNWSSSEEVTKRLITQFLVSDNQIDCINFVHDNEYDLLVVFGYINSEIKDETPIILFPQEPSWSGGHPRYFEENKNLKIFGFDKNLYNTNNTVIECISHMFYGGRGPWEEGYEFWNYQNITQSDFNKTKGICSFISNRGINDVEFSDGCLYKDRINLVQTINKSSFFIDFYGWGNENNLKPFVGKKGETIKDYKFCLTVENSNEKNYLSEKFFDCILTNTIPIYFGCKNIKEIWPENGYILLDNIIDYPSIIDKLNYINSHSDEIYSEMLPELKKMKKRYFEEYNLINKIKKEFDEF